MTMMSSDPPAEDRLEIAATNQRVWTAGLAALTTLRQHHIPVLILKSLPEVEDLYGDAGGRQTLDVDLLVPVARLEEAFQCLCALGLAPRQGRDYADFAAESVRRGFAEALRSRKWTLIPSGEADADDIDLHNDAIDIWRSPALRAGVWSHARPCQRDGVDFLVLGAEDRLIFLCWELVEEGFKRRKMTDLERALQQGTALNWTEVAQRSSALGVALTVQLAVDVVAQRHPGAAAPSAHWRLPAHLRLRRAFLLQLLKRRSLPLTGVEARMVRILAHDHPLGVWGPAFLTWALPPRSRSTLSPDSTAAPVSYLRLLGQLWRERLCDLRHNLRR